jgi:hypothetical protein
MIGMAIIFFSLTAVIALLYRAWVTTDKETRYFVLKNMFKGALFASAAFAILFVIVNVF